MKKEEILIMMVNIQSLRGHQAELQFHLAARRPQIAFLQETWLDESTEEVKIANYKTLARRDRSKEPNRGGVLTLVRDDFNSLVYVSTSETEERIWHFLNVGVENILVGNWYRPGSSEYDEFNALQNEIAAMSSEFTGIILTAT